MLRIPSDLRGPLAWTLAALLLALGSLALWIERDRFVDREEAQHVLRAVETDGAAFGSFERTRSLGVLFRGRIDQPKPWYGWPYYLAVALLWELFGASADAGVYANLLFLALAAGAAFFIARRLGGAAAAAPTAVFLVLAPGVLIWGHLFGPSLFLLAALALTVALLVGADEGRNPWLSLLAGLFAAATSIAKLSLVFCWLPIFLWGLRDLRHRERRRGRLPHLALFGAGLLPLPLYLWISREALAYWTPNIRALYGSPSFAEFLRGTWHRWFEILMPVQTVLALFAFFLLAKRGGRRSLGYLAWFALPIAGLGLLMRAPGTTRDAIPGLLALAVAFGCGIATLTPARQRAVLALLFVSALLFIPVNLFGRGGDHRPPFGAYGWLRADIDGVHQGQVRLTPAPDLVAAIEERLAEVLPPGTPGRCSGLPALPYPVANTDALPLVELDSSRVGPENLYAAEVLEGRKARWALGYVPYPLSCGAYRLSVDCASVRLVSEPPFQSEYPGGEDKAAERRGEAWGRLAGTIALPDAPKHWLLASISGPLSSGGRLARLPQGLESCPADDYYAAYLRLARSGASPSRAGIAAARRLAEARKVRLASGGDPAAVLFGEAYLVDWTLAELDRMAAPAAGGASR